MSQNKSESIGSQVGRLAMRVLDMFLEEPSGVVLTDEFCEAVRTAKTRRDPPEPVPAPAPPSGSHRDRKPHFSEVG
jgi:hypothetical protein